MARGPSSSGTASTRRNSFDDELRRTGGVYQAQDDAASIVSFIQQRDLVRCIATVRLKFTRLTNPRCPR
jgi:hypothetical protein